MKKIIFLLSIFFLMEMGLYAQEMKLPPALDNAFLKAYEGFWVSDEYEFLGVKWHDESVANWTLNNQFLEMKIITYGPGRFSFKSYAIMTADKEGNFKQWTFDDWGQASAGFFEGKIDGMTLKFKGESTYMIGSGVMVIEGNTITQDITFTEKNEQGNEVTSIVKIVYRKK